MFLNSPNFSGVVAKYFSSNIHRLESLAGCFICLRCGPGEWRASWDPDDFSAHINTVHHDVKLLPCIFCGIEWPKDGFVAHIASHFSVFRGHVTHLYSCPIRHSTLCPFQTDSIHSLRIHLSIAHRGKNTVYKCVHCSKEVLTIDAWTSHIAAHTVRLCHCMADGCNVKSPSKQLITNHIKRKHGADSLGLLHENIEFICTHNGIVPSFLRGFFFGGHNPFPSPTSLSSTMIGRSQSLPTAGVRNGQSCAPLCLRCSKCHMATISWSKFQNHMTVCSEDALTCDLYWCPHCQTVSTEKSLVEEHVQTVHDTIVPVIHEKFEQTASTLGTPASCSQLPGANTTAVSDLQLPPTSAPHNVFTAFSKLLPPPPPPPMQSNTTTVISPAIKTEMSSPEANGVDNPIFSSHPFLDPSNFTAVAAMAAALTGLAMNNSQPPQPASSIIETNDQEYKENGTDVEAHSNGLDESSNTPASSTTTADETVKAGRTGEEELVSFPFDEIQFRNEMSHKLLPDVIDQLVEKMHQFSSYVIRILGKENHRRVPQCPECDRVFSYGLPDFKRHLLAIHLSAPREHLKDLLRFVRFPKIETALSDKQEQAAMRQMCPKEIEPGVRKIPLPYSISILRRLTTGLQDNIRDYIATKMRTYSQMSAIYELRAGLKRYKCGHCPYSSPHALADVRKHILGSHCGISTKHFRFCLQASRLDHVEFRLLSDEKLSRLAQEFLTRRQVESAESEASSIGTCVKQPSRTPSPENSKTIPREPDENGVSRFTTMIPGSKVPVKVRIRGPVPPGDGTTSPLSNSFLSTSSNSASLELSDFPKIPGLESANRILDLPLPYSESVLRQLLEDAGALPHQIEEMCAKMQVYSASTMTRICHGDRTLAFRCSCGRLFITTRQPDSKMRAATLADSRRHVMGVHARIPHEYITICCQASRISRENGFQLYPDEMLHRLALDRPIKLNSPDAPSTGHTHRSPSKSGSSKLKSLPPLRPLADLSGENSEDEKPLINSRLSLPPAFHALSDSISKAHSGAGFGDETDESIDSELVDPMAVLACLNEQLPKDIERIIDLPYSKTALQVLVRGYCPPSYFGILLNKMQVYAAYKVFVTRRRGRRFFCCSGCNSVSPHGMGDIRKHILGVHAKVPERYKAAAMHCSRLSREDNSLLADRSLLQLAKMKWKGTVIKPLAEITIPGGFSGAVSLKSEDPGPATPISRHLRNSVNRVPEDTAMVAIVATPHTSGDLFSCSACTVASTDCAAMRSHVAREHLGARAYDCPQCPDIFNLSADLISHCTNVHQECTPVIPPLLLPISFQEAMSSVVVNHMETRLSPTTVATKEAVAMEDDEMGKLWASLFDGNAAAASSLASTNNGILDPSPAVFPTPNGPLCVENHQLDSKLPSNGVGSSRRKPCKANLVQLKQPKTSTECDVGVDRGRQISPPSKRVRLEGMGETVDC